MQQESFNHPGYGFRTDHSVFKGVSLRCEVLAGDGRVRNTLLGPDADAQYRADLKGTANARRA